MKIKFKKAAAMLLLALTASSFVFSQELGDCSHGGYLYDNGDMIAHTVDYSRYFTCLDGVWVDGYCPDGLWFNSMRQMCDFPLNVPFPGT